MAILSDKYILPAFRTMNGIDLSRNATGLLIRINAVTGWRLPEDPQLAQVLNAEFTEYLQTNAADLNSKELISAIRINGLNIIEWGKSMNLAFIDQCIIPYKLQRQALSQVEERHSMELSSAKKEELPAGTVDWSEEWNKVVYGAKIGQIRNVWVVTDLYDWLIKSEKMPAPDKTSKWKVVKYCAARYLEEITDHLLNGGGTEQPYELRRRIALLSNKERPIWKKDTAIMSVLTNLAKIETVRRLAVETAKLLPDEG